MNQAASVDTRRPRVLYLVYWGAAEPLGQSLVLPAVVRLSQLGAQLTLVTFEKPTDLQRTDEMRRIRGLLSDAGVEWLPLRYHKRPKWPATLLDALNAARLAVRLGWRRPFDILHARTFVAGVMGLAIAPLIGARLVFHNEGFYPDEQVDGGFWKRDSWQHRLAKRLEGRLYDTARGIVVLSTHARTQVSSRPAVQARSTPIIVVPSCVDLDRFEPSRPRSDCRATGVNLVYLGSVGGRYRFDQVGAFAAAVRRLAGHVHVRVLTPTYPGAVAALLRDGGLAEDEYSIDSVPHSRVPEELARQHAGLSFYTSGLSEHGCSPTKIGEYWAAGLPIVVSPNIGDVGDALARFGVGVVVPELSPAAYERAAAELINLLGTPGLAERCRQAAEAYYALEPACQAQRELYHVTSATRGKQAI